MSEPREKYTFKPVPVRIKSLDQTMFDAYMEEEYKRGRVEALEEACKAVCWGCAIGDEVRATDSKIYYYHVDERNPGKVEYACKARDIRKLMGTSKEQVAVIDII
jgi:hypothetical protein